MRLSTMTSIAFVDHDHSLIRALTEFSQEQQGSRSGESAQWHFLDKASDLLALMETDEIDCVVTDMQISVDDGARLLSHIASEHPNTVRIATSDLVDAELTLESLHASHRFIPKPAEAGTLLEAIERSMSLHGELGDTRLRKLVSSITALPVMPEIYNHLMQELASPNYSIDSVGEIIESDISLSATLLRVVNSPYYGLVRHVESATHAAQLLGVELVKNILLYEKVLSQFTSQSVNDERMRELNDTARMRGVLANRFARLASFGKRQIDHAQIAGMLSNLGDLVIAANMISPEQQVASSFNVDQIGSSIMSLWSLPDPIVETVLQQREQQTPQGELSVSHVVHTLRRLENLHAQCDYRLDGDFNMQAALPPDTPVDESLQAKWFDCFRDYHLELEQQDLKQAA